MNQQLELPGVPGAPLHKYTVLLLRPDYVASEFGKDTYLAHVVAAGGVAQAQAFGQIEAWGSDNETDDDADPANHGDYHVLFVALGHLTDLSVGETHEGETR